MASLPLFPSCRVPVVVIQHAVQPLAPADNPCVFRDTLDWNDEPISEPLMVPLGVIMCDEIVVAFRKESSPKKIILSKQLSLIVRTNRSAYAFLLPSILTTGSRWE